MPKFNTDKKGYAPKEVDEYIQNLCVKYEEKLSEQKDRVFSLKQELDLANGQLKEYIEKDKQISQALMYAVEKADEIEAGAKKIYELEIKRVRLLYKRWEDLLLEVEGKCPQINTNGYINGLLEAFKKSIGEVLEQNMKLSKVSESVGSMKDNLKKKSDNYIKNILNKMNYAFTYQTQMDLPDEAMKEEHIVKVDMSDVLQNHNKEKSRMQDIENKIGLLNKQSADDAVENYLNSDWDDRFSNTVYAKTITRQAPTKEDDSVFNYAYPTPNGSGFDFKEALNPKEELDEIMKSFDFYTPNNSTPAPDDKAGK